MESIVYKHINADSKLYLCEVGLPPFEWPLEGSYIPMIFIIFQII